MPTESLLSTRADIQAERLSSIQADIQLLAEEPPCSALRAFWRDPTTTIDQREFLVPFEGGSYFDGASERSHGQLGLRGEQLGRKVGDVRRS